MDKTKYVRLIKRDVRGKFAISYNLFKKAIHQLKETERFLMMKKRG